MFDLCAYFGLKSVGFSSLVDDIRILYIFIPDVRPHVVEKQRPNHVIRTAPVILSLRILMMKPKLRKKLRLIFYIFDLINIFDLQFRFSFYYTRVAEQATSLSFRRTEIKAHQGVTSFPFSLFDI